MYFTAILSNTATIRGGNWTEIDTVFISESGTLLHAITAQSHKQPNKLSQLHKLQLNLLTVYGNFPCYLKVNRDKLALINRQRKCEKGGILTINAISFTKMDQLDGFRPL